MPSRNIPYRSPNQIVTEGQGESTPRVTLAFPENCMQNKPLLNPRSERVATRGPRARMTTKVTQPTRGCQKSSRRQKQTHAPASLHAHGTESENLVGEVLAQRSENPCSCRHAMAWQTLDRRCAVGRTCCWKITNGKCREAKPTNTGRRDHKCRRPNTRTEGTREESTTTTFGTPLQVSTERQVHDK